MLPLLWIELNVISASILLSVHDSGVVVGHRVAPQLPPDRAPVPAKVTRDLRPVLSRGAQRRHRAAFFGIELLVVQRHSLPPVPLNQKLLAPSPPTPVLHLFCEFAPRI